MTKKVKELIAEYTYNDLGFPIIIRDVVIVEDRGYTYPLINQNGIMLQVAYSLVTEHHLLDGARLHFVRRFLNLSLDQFASSIGNISKSTLHKWESEKDKICDLSHEQLRSIYFELKNEIISQIGKTMDKELVKDFSDGAEIPPLNIAKNNLIAV
ncbi:MAG: helix-turn-helix domain-containing protein [Bacteriovoracaceae bacterium]